MALPTFFAMFDLVTTKKRMVAHGSSGKLDEEQEHRSTAKRRNAPLQPGLQVVATLLALRVGYRLAKTAGEGSDQKTYQLACLHCRQQFAENCSSLYFCNRSWQASC